MANNVYVVQAFQNPRDTRGSPCPRDAAMKRIRAGENGLVEKTRYCNALVISDPRAHGVYKCQNLSAITFLGIFPKGKRKVHYLQQHSRLVTLDIDRLNPNDTAYQLCVPAWMPQVVSALTSPSRWITFFTLDRTLFVEVYYYRVDVHALCLQRTPTETYLLENPFNKYFNTDASMPCVLVLYRRFLYE